MTTPEQALANARQRSRDRQLYESQTLRDNKDTYKQMSGLSMAQAKLLTNDAFAVELENLVIDGPAQIGMTVGSEISLHAYLLYKNNGLQRVPRDLVVEWASSDDTKATVSMGVVTALLAGTTVITATDGSFTSNSITIVVS